MKKIFLTAVFSVLALTASVNANAMSAMEGETSVAEVAANLSNDNAYYYTILCQRYLNDAKQIKMSDRMSDEQKQNRLSVLTSLYIDEFSKILDSWQTMTTIKCLTE